MQGGPLTKYAGIIEGISGGVFMYISLFHIFHEELESSDRTLAKISTFAVAVLIMFGLEQVT